MNGDIYLMGILKLRLSLSLSLSISVSLTSTFCHLFNENIRVAARLQSKRNVGLRREAKRLATSHNLTPLLHLELVF